MSVAVGDGNNTIVGSNGNDLIVTDDSFANGTGSNDLITLGGGKDTYWGGLAMVEATGDWYNDGQIDISKTGSLPPDYTNPYPQPYNGFQYEFIETGEVFPAGAANVTILGGTGDYLLALPNGNNFVEMGSGNSWVDAGMGNNTIIAGSGSDTILGGGGTTYIYGGSGADSIWGGDGSNTIIGGSGNSTITSASWPDENDPLESFQQNYVTGGSGNDVIYGSAGNDTL
ncbi:MAG TPA: hypothetical protein VNO35_35790, partial [Steroidobacteraceae bacterium]|nr:hypothetical protein [Steroidobacteraceae bacterium]